MLSLSIGDSSVTPYLFVFFFVFFFSLVPPNSGDSGGTWITNRPRLFFFFFFLFIVFASNGRLRFLTDFRLSTIRHLKSLMEVRVTKFFCKNRNGRYEIENERERRRVNGVCGHCHRVLINTFEFHHRQISFGRSFDDEFFERSTWWSVLLLLLLLMTDYWLLLILFAFSFLDNKKKKKKKEKEKRDLSYLCQLRATFSKTVSQISEQSE